MDVFTDCDDPPTTQLLPKPQTCQDIDKFLSGFKGRGLKGARDGNPPSHDPALTPSTSQVAGKKAKVIMVGSSSERSVQAVDDVLGTCTSRGRSRTPTVGTSEKIVKIAPSSLVQARFITRPLVEILHLEFESEVVGKSRAGIDGGSPNNSSGCIPSAAQEVTVTDSSIQSRCMSAPGSRHRTGT